MTVIAIAYFSCLNHAGCVTVLQGILVGGGGKGVDQHLLICSYNTEIIHTSRWLFACPRPLPSQRMACSPAQPAGLLSLEDVERKSISRPPILDGHVDPQLRHGLEVARVPQLAHPHRGEANSSDDLRRNESNDAGRGAGAAQVTSRCVWTCPDWYG